MNSNCLSFLLLLVVAMACTGSLTPEQREKARKAIEEGRIKRITPAQLTEEALKNGKRIVEAIGGKDSFFNNATFIDSVAISNEVKIYVLKPGLNNLSKEEASIAEAYQAQGDIADVGDNVQKLSSDSLLYTMPVGNKSPDGSKPFSHAIAVKMAVKKLVMRIKEE